MTEVQRPQYFPADTFHDQNAQCDITDIVFVATGATNNQQVIAAVTGKVIMVISANVYSAGIATTLTFISDAAAGTPVNKYAMQVPVNTAATPNVQLPFNLAGHFRTATGKGLYVDNVAAVQAVISLTYITYTP